MRDPTTRELAQQLNLLNASMHAVFAVLTSDQRARAAPLLEGAAQQVLAALESSAASDAEVALVVDLRDSLLRALQFQT